MSEAQSTQTKSGFHNWIKASLALLYTKEEIAPVVFDVVLAFQEKCLREIAKENSLPPGSTCNTCCTENVIECPRIGLCNVRRGKCTYHRMYSPSVCPNKICHNLKSRIQKAHRYNCPSFANTNASQWCTNPWEIAKCFMPPHGYKNVLNAADTDFIGIISVVLNHVEFDAKIHDDLSKRDNIFVMGRDACSAIRHSVNLEVTDAELKRYFTILSNILNDPGLKAVNKLQNNAIKKLTQLQNDELSVIGKDAEHFLNYGGNVILQKQIKDEKSKDKHNDNLFVTVAKTMRGIQEYISIGKLGEMTKALFDEINAFVKKSEEEDQVQQKKAEIVEEEEHSLQEIQDSKRTVVMKDEMYAKRKKGAWDDSIERVSTLVREKILPSQSEVNRACHVFGRHSKIVWDMCTIICEHIRGQLEDINSVWPAYVLEDRISSVIFMVVVKKESDLPVLKDYNCKLLIENETNNEGKLVASKEIFDDISNEQSYADALKEIRVCINKNADDLFTRHSNLNAILPSLKKSTGYISGSHDITITPCIALYVRSKGFIPLKEEPFKETIGDFQIDVLEGIFTPFIGRATDYHPQLKIGLAIHGRDSSVAGTLGGFVEHSTHGICGITCAHVLYDSQEMTQIKESGSWQRKEVHQPFGQHSEEFGHVVEAVFHEGNDSSPGVDVALIKIMRRHPQNGSFPLSLNDVHAGFDDHRPLYFNSGEVCASSDINMWSVVFKFGMVTGITRGSFEMQGAALRKYDLVGQNQSFGYFLKDQLVILKVGNEPFAVIGDSGSLVMMKGNQDSVAIGLVEGGLNDGRVFVTPICDNLKAIGCADMKMCQFRNNNENIIISAKSLAERIEGMEVHVDITL